MFTLVYGGSASGKSEYAESLLLTSRAKRIYIATMQPFDQECRDRIKRHRQMRAKKMFHTVECYVGLQQIEFEDGCDVLLECMSNLVANEMFSKEGTKSDTIHFVLDGVKRLIEKSNHLVIVTNNLFEDGITYDLETQNYLRTLGHINTELAKLADEVIEVVYSIPVILKKKI